jgi:hypothetical protein
MSASAPTAIAPLRGARPYMRAWLVAVSATNSWMSMRPFTNPSENSSGMRSSMPGTPLAISLKVVASPLGSLPVSSKR